MSIPQNRSLDDLNIELDAMQTIARALAGVRDPEARLRILRWTSERFAAPSPSAGVKDARPAQTSDPTLTVEGLHLFDDDGIIEPVDEPAMAPAAMAAEQPLDSLVRGFATDIRTLALQWQGA